MSTTNLQVIFDNGGGITVQCDDYAHHYGGFEGCEKKAAEDYRDLAAGDDPAGWEGNSNEDRTNPSDDDIRNGGYRVYCADEIGGQIAIGEIDTQWANIDLFFAALGCKVAA